MKNKLIFIYITIFSLLFACFAFSICLGAEKISLTEIFQCIFNSENSLENYKKSIIWELRLPRSILVLLTGLLLGGSGAIFQMFFRNSLAEPSLMGISSGATLGAVLSQTVFSSSSFLIINRIQELHSILSLHIFAFLGALLSGTIVTLLACTKTGSSSTIMLLLCGTALGTLYSASSSLLLIINNNKLINIYGWISGSFNGRGWNELIFILIPSFIALFLMFLLISKLDYLNGGEISAQSLGISLKKLKIMVLICGSLSISASVCAGGTIGFIGLMAPHIIRKTIGPRAKHLVPLSLISGAILLLISDTVARTLIAPAELPAGIITSLLGVPFFLSIILGKNGKKQSNYGK